MRATKLLALIALMVVAPLSFAPAQPTTVAEQGAEAPDLGAELPDGVSLTPLALEVENELDRQLSPFGRYTMALIRLPIDPRSKLDARDLFDSGYDLAFVTNLLYVQTGEPTLIVDGNERRFRPGQHILLPQTTEYRIRNDTGACTSLLRLTVIDIDKIGKGGGGTGSEETQNLPSTCGKPTILITAPQGPRPLGPMLLFVARVTWESEASLFIFDGHPGPISLVVESGRLSFTDSRPKSIRTELTEGGMVAFPYGLPYNIYNPSPEPATALMVGWIAADEGLHARSHHYSQTYRLTWDDKWTQTSESEAGGVGRLDLSNFASTVTFEDYASEDSAADCLAGVVATLTSDPNVRDEELRDDLSARPPKVSGVASTSAHYAYTYTYDDGTSEQWIVCFECHQVTTSARALVLITAIMPLQDFDAQSRLVQQLLDGLVLG